VEISSRLTQQLKGRNDLLSLNRLYFDMLWKQLDWAEYEAEVRTSDAAIRLASEIGVPPVQYSTLKALGLLQLGRYGEAWESLEREVVDSEHPFGQAMQILGIAQYHWELQAFDEAARACRELQQRATLLHRAWMRRFAAGLLVRCLARRGELSESSRREIQGELGRLGERVLREVKAEAMLAEGRSEAALLEAAALADEARTGDHMAKLLTALELQAQALLYLGRAGELLPLLEEGGRLAHERKALSMAWKFLYLKGRALKALGDQDGAREALSEGVAIIRRIGESIRDSEAKRRFFDSPPVASVMEVSE
jgi:tetratricopeptide (TPR) repeat protein